MGKMSKDAAMKNEEAPCSPRIGDRVDSVPRCTGRSGPQEGIVRFARKTEENPQDMSSIPAVLTSSLLHSIDTDKEEDKGYMESQG